MLPFKTFNSQREEFYEITDDRGNVLSVPKKGSFSLDEQTIYAQTTAEWYEKKEEPFDIYKTNLAGKLLIVRLGLLPETPIEKIFLYPDGTPVSFALIENLYEFFMKERYRWKEPPTEEVSEDVGEKK